jgi:hypothetical protein
MSCELKKLIELDDSIKYTRSVLADSLSMFPDITSSHDFIQFETGSNSSKSD